MSTSSSSLLCLFYVQDSRYVIGLKIMFFYILLHLIKNGITCTTLVHKQSQTVQRAMPTASFPTKVIFRRRDGTFNLSIADECITFQAHIFCKFITRNTWTAPFSPTLIINEDLLYRLNVAYINVHFKFHWVADYLP